MKSHRPLTSLPILAAIVVILAIYSYPTLKTATVTGSRTIPAVIAPDTSLYLNISAIKETGASDIVDPYYGMRVPKTQLGYLKFRTAFVLFAGLNALMQGKTWWALLVWNLFWCTLLCSIAAWFLREFLPRGSPLIVVFGIAVLMLFNFGVLQSNLAAWRFLPSLHGFESVELPFIRPFFPQLPIPLLLLYLGLQIKALQKSSWTIWISMAVTQFVTFTIFPYAMLMMAGLSAIAIGGNFLSHGIKSIGRFAIVYGILCAVSDALFLLHGIHRSGPAAPSQEPLIHFQISMLAHRMGGTFFLVFALTAAVAILRRMAPETKWSIVGLGLSNLLLLLGDVLFSEAALQISHHAGYFVHLTVTVLTLFLVAAGVEYLGASHKLGEQLGLACFIVILTLNGVFISYANYRHFLPFNKELVAFALALQSTGPNPSDLIVTRALTVDDNCAWVSLLSSSHSLFCRNGQVLFGPEQNQSIQRFRQSLYLYFMGRSRSWAERILNEANNESELSRLMFLGEYSSDARETRKHIESVRASLIPFLAKAEGGDPAVRSFLSSYRRILVIDNGSQPNFVDDKLSSYLRVEGRRVTGDFVVLDCHPLP